MVLLFYTTYISVDIAHHELFHAKVGKGGITIYISSMLMPRDDVGSTLCVYWASVNKWLKINKSIRHAMVVLLRYPC